MPITITRVDAYDIRFPTSRALDGSDAMNPDPDYSAARALAPLVFGVTLEEIQGDMAGFWRRVTSESQLRWVGPEKGVLHLATAAVVNAVWDLWAKVEGVPLWKLLVSMSPEELVRCVDFRYITDAITSEEAVELLHRNADTRSQREAELVRDGYPAYTTSA